MTKQSTRSRAPIERVARRNYLIFCSVAVIVVTAFVVTVIMLLDPSGG